MLRVTNWLPAIALFLSTLMASLIGMSATVHAEGRIALVIGNSAYRNVSVLGNPANDAADVSQSLRRLGFDVTTVSDAGFDAFRRALIEFGESGAQRRYGGAVLRRSRRGNPGRELAPAGGRGT